jgi:putative ABC transport system permease protein
LLTAVGVVAIVGSAVAGRRREIGIRLALGARPERLWTTIVGRIAVPVVIGVVMGLAVTLWFTGLSVAAPLDTDTGRYSLLSLSVVATVAAAGIAASIPARRASRIDPMSVLRTD